MFLEISIIRVQNRLDPDQPEILKMLSTEIIERQKEKNKRLLGEISNLFKQLIMNFIVTDSAVPDKMLFSVAIYPDFNSLLMFDVWDSRHVCFFSACFYFVVIDVFIEGNTERATHRCKSVNGYCLRCHRASYIL